MFREQLIARNSHHVGLCVAAAIATVFVCYFEVLAATIRMWATNPRYSYGFVVPLVAAYVLWTTWPKERPWRIAPDYWLGVPITLAGIGLLLIGHFGAIFSLEQASLVVTLAGFGLLLFGHDDFSAGWFPLLYLLFGMQLWNPLIIRLQPPSQLLSGRIAVTVLNLTGVPASQDGMMILLPGLTLEVLRECSGVNQLIAIVAMTVPAAYLLLEDRARRSALIAAAIVVAYLINGFRIALTGILALHGIGINAPRAVHLLEGVGMSLIGYALIIGCLCLLWRSARSDPPRGTMEEEAECITPLDCLRPSARHIWLECSIFLLVLAAGSVQMLFRPADVRLPRELSSFPSRIGEWEVDTSEQKNVRFPAIDETGWHGYPSPSGPRRFINVDDELIRTYTTISGGRVRLYVGYYRHQGDDQELAGAASDVLHAGATRLTIEGVDAKALEVNQVRESRPARGIFFWYDLNGRMLSSLAAVKARMVWDAFTRGRTNGAVIMVGWEGAPPADAAASRENAIGFVRALVPILADYLHS